MKTILILSCGTRNKLVRFFKETMGALPGGGRVVVTDCSPWAPALYEADAWYLVPPITAPRYLSCVQEICQKENVDALLPLFEDELDLLAQNRKLFEEQGRYVIVSASETVALCRDKYRFYRHLLKHGLPALPTCASLEEFARARASGQMDFPVFVKPVRGCGSAGAGRVEEERLLQALWENGGNSRPEDGGSPFLIQQYACGEEFGADLYVDLISRKPVAMFTKKKVRMRAGETEKAVSVKDPALFELLRRTAATLDLAGPVDVDIFRVDGRYYISEINPRFGGGYPLAYHCHVNFPALIANNLEGVTNEDRTGEYEEGMCMMKYSDEIVKKLEP